MSAIYGLVDFQDNLTDNSIINSFNDYYSSFSIDKVNSISEANFCFGCGLQSFNIDKQPEFLPRYDADKRIVLTADCIIDNRAELAEELGLDKRAPHADFIYNAYLKWGIDCLKRLKGVFAFVIYDFFKDRIYLATDQFSQRCLFYHIRENKLYFSTLLMPIIKYSGLTYEENERWLVDTISMRSPAMILEPKECSIRDIFKVVCGTYIEINTETSDVTEVRYYDPAASIPTDKSITPAQGMAMMRAGMKSVIGSITDYDYNFAAQLSSGLDSSTVACIAASILLPQNKKLRTYTSIPLKSAELPSKGYLVYDESEGVKKICDAYPNIVPSFIDVPERHYLNEVEYMIGTWELPCKSEQNAVWVDEISRQAAADGCKVLLAGSTGNCTISAGRYEDMLFHDFTHFHFSKLSRELNNLSNLGASKKRFTKNIIKDFINYYTWGFNKENKDCYKMTVTNKSVGEKYNLTKRFIKEVYHCYPFYNLKEYRRQMYLVNANAQIGEIDTKYSLTHGIVTRDPMRTVDIVNICFKLPMTSYVGEQYDRQLVRVGMEGIVPIEICHDVKHRGRQSGDNEYRMSLVWEDKLPEIKKMLFDSKTLRYLSKEALEEYLGRLSADNLSDNFMDTRMIVDAYTFAHYLELLHSAGTVK